MMPIEAIDQVITDTRQLIDDGGSYGEDGIIRIARELGLDVEELNVGATALELFSRATGMPRDAALLGAFVCGAYWHRAQETVVTDEMVERGAEKIASETTIPVPDDPLIREFLADAQRGLAREVLVAALSPAVDPPTDDGAEASS
jgi:hypothetical protein